MRDRYRTTGDRRRSTAVVWRNAHSEQVRVLVQLFDLLPGDGGDQVGVRDAQPGPVGVFGLVTGAVRLQGEPFGVVLAVLRPQVAEGVAPVQIQRAAEPMPAEPIR